MDKNNDFFIVVIVLLLLNSALSFSIASRVQSYDNNFNPVSVAYGKDTNRAKEETATNQQIKRSRSLCPMEKFRVVRLKEPTH